MTNVRISISISQTFCSWVLSSNIHLHWPLTLTSHSLHDTPRLVPHKTVLFILRARRLSNKLLKQGYIMERLKSSFKTFHGRYRDLVSFWRMLNDILELDQLQWLQTLHQFYDPDIKLELYRISRGFHEAIATGVACQLGKLTLPGTWFHPFLRSLYDLIIETILSLFSLFTSNVPRYCQVKNIEI